MKNVTLPVLARQAASLTTLLSDEDRWLQGTPAQDKYENDCDPLERRACKFCLIGGIEHVTGSAAEAHPLGLLVANVIRGIEVAQWDDHTRPGNVWFFLEPDQLNASHLYSFNDERTHAEVMEVLRTAQVFAEAAAGVA